MNINLQKLNDINACMDGIEYFKSKKQDSMTIKQAVQYCIEDSKFDYANWLLTKIFTHKQCVQYAVFAAEQVLHIFEAKYPNDNRPRLAIQAAKDWLINPCEIAAAHTAAYATARTAVIATSYATDYAAADAAANAADAARNAYYAASYAADAAHCAARYAVDAATNVDNAASMHTAIFNYGLKLLGQ